jgi:hypothetical protein
LPGRESQDILLRAPALCGPTKPTQPRHAAGLFPPVGLQGKFAMGQSNSGANFEIVVDGKPRSYRDDPKIAAEAAAYLKSKNPKVEVAIRDLRTNIVTSVAWASQVPLTPSKGL